MSVDQLVAAGPLIGILLLAALGICGGLLMWAKWGAGGRGDA
jgi:hypothetical protein